MRIFFLKTLDSGEGEKKRPVSMKGNTDEIGSIFSVDIFCAEISARKSQRLWGSLNMNFDARGCLLLLNQNR
jgi:hypothetical protein